jgi:hypothetical protein
MDMAETPKPHSEKETKATQEAHEHGPECKCGCHDAVSACECFRHYARQRPEVVAMWCFGIGFIMGWKMHPRRSA